MGEEHLDPAWAFGMRKRALRSRSAAIRTRFVTIKGWQPATVAEELERNPGIVVTAGAV